jgi:opacity protein-like surface antigen
MKSIAFAALLAALPMASAFAAPSVPQASIPFVNHGGIRDWRAADHDTLYVQDQRRNWYRAELFAPCLDLPFAHAIGFETRGIDRFDRFSSIRVRGQRCAVQSLVRSEPPVIERRAKRS